MLYAAWGFIGNLNLIWPPRLAEDPRWRHQKQSDEQIQWSISPVLYVSNLHQFTFAEMDKESKVQVSKKSF